MAYPNLRLDKPLICAGCRKQIKPPAEVVVVEMKFLRETTPHGEAPISELIGDDITAIYHRECYEQDRGIN